jgi:hypothetical protein
MGGSCSRIEPSGREGGMKAVSDFVFHKCGEYLDQLSDFLLKKQDPIPWSFLELMKLFDVV